MTDNRIVEYLDSLKPSLQSIAPPGYDVDRVCRDVLESLRQFSITPTRENLSAILGPAVRFGLDPSGRSGDGVLVQKKTKIVFIPSYRALLRLAYANPRIVHVEAHVVRAKDEFAIDYGAGTLTHRPYVGPGANSEKNPPVGAYALAYLRDSPKPIFEWLPADEIEAISKRGSERREYSPWNSDWSEMARKTALKRLLKYLPLRPDVWSQVGEFADEEDAACEESADLSLPDYEAKIREADLATISQVLKSIREDDRLDSSEKERLFNLAVKRKRELLESLKERKPAHVSH